MSSVCEGGTCTYLQQIRKSLKPRHCRTLKDRDTFSLGIHVKDMRLLFQFPSQSAQEHRKKHVWSYAHQGFLITKESLRKLRIIEHGLQKVFFVANKAYNVVVVAPVGRYSFH